MLPEPLLQCGSRNENNRHVQAARSAALPRNALIHIRFLVLPARAVIRYSCCTVNKSNTGLSVPSCLWLQVALAVLHSLRGSLQHCLRGWTQSLHSTTIKWTVLSQSLLGKRKGGPCTWHWWTGGSTWPRDSPQAPGKQRAGTASLTQDCSWNTTYSQKQLLLKYRD